MRKLLPLFTLSTVLVAGCSQASEEDYQWEFRDGLAQDGNESNSDHLFIYSSDEEQKAGTGTGTGGLIPIWDINEYTVTNAHGGIVLRMDGANVADPRGNPTCRRKINRADKTTSLVDQRSGEAIFTVWRRWAFAGDMDMTGLSCWEQLQMMHDNILYTYKGTKMYEGFSFEDNVVAYGSKSLQCQSRMRKLLVTTLAEGECGGPGWPED